MKYVTVLWVLLFGLVSCVPQSSVLMNGKPDNSQASGMQSAQTVNTTASTTQGVQQPTPVKPYTGPIVVKIDTGMTNKNNPNRRILTMKESQGSFQVKALPTGPVVFQETFVRTQAQDTVQRTFTVTDPAKFYTLHVQNGDAQGNNETTSAVINLNGFDWVRPNEIKKNIPEVQKDNVLLQATNTLTVTHHGSPGSIFTLTVVEGGQSGTIRRRNGPLNDHPTQADHVKAHDKNIFDPADIGSLGDLKAAEGDTVLEGGLQVSQFGLIEADQYNLPIGFEAGVLTIEFQNPTTDVATFQQLYGGTVRGSLEVGNTQFHDIQLDLDRSPVRQVEELVRAFNVKYNRAISEVSLSSWAAFRTFVLELDILVNHADIVKSVSVNGVAPLPLSSGDVVVVDSSNDAAVDDPYKGIPSAINAYGKSWRLNDPRVRQAWNYSLGTGTTVAWLDTGYFKQDFLSSPATANPEIHPELENRLTNQRVYFKNQKNNQINDPTAADKDIRGSSQALTNKTDDHGLICVQVGFGERNNGIGGAGVAPNANVILYHTGYSTTTNHAGALKAAIGTYSNTPKVNVIGMNMAWVGDDTLAGYPDVVNAINEALKRNIPVIVAAGNFAVPIRISNQAKFVPAGSLLLHNKLIVAAATMANFDGSKGPIREVDATTRVVNGEPAQLNTYDRFALTAWVDPQLQVGISSSGSNFDALNPGNIFWLPGHQIITTKSDDASITLPAAGTSMACPQLTGIVALMKSRNPFLTPDQIKNILKSNSYLPVMPSDEMKKYGLTKNSSHFVDAFSAVVRAIDTSDPNFDTTSGAIPSGFKTKHEAQPFMGVVDTTFGKKLKLNMSVHSNSAPTDKTKTLIQSINNAQWNRLTQGSLFKIIGWSSDSLYKGTKPLDIAQGESLAAGNLEILDIQPITTQPHIKSANLIQSGLNITAINKSSPLKVEINGTDLMANLASNAPITLTFVSSSGNKDFTMNFAESTENLNNAGTQAIFELTSSELNSLTSGSSYKIRVSGANGTSGEVGPAAGFAIANTVPLTGIASGYNVIGDFAVRSSIVMGAPVETIDNITIYLGPKAEVTRGDIVAVDLTGTPLANEPDKATLQLALANQSTPINGINVPVQAVVNEMLLFGIPNGMDEGLYRLIIKAAGGNGISIVDAVRLLGSQPSNVPSGPSFTVWSARVYNVSDRTRIVLDNNAVLAEGFPGVDNSFSITANIVGTHKLRFEAYNDDTATGASWGFDVKANGKLVYRDVQGNSQTRTNANELLIFPFSALMGNGPYSPGLVFSQELVVKQNQAPFGFLNSYTAKLFNASDETELMVNGDPLFTVADDGSGQAQNSGTFNHRLQFGTGNEVRFKVRKGPKDKQFTGKHFTYGMEVKYGSQLIYHYLDGQRHLVNERTAGARWHEEALIGQPLLDETFLVFQ